MDIPPKPPESKSLWNFTSSPGWSQAESDVLRLGLLKYGIGNWSMIISAKILPGKSHSQLVCQTQRLLGQQSLAEFTGIKLDAARVFASNASKNGPQFVRKAGVLINTGDALSPEERAIRWSENSHRYGISDEEASRIIIPSLTEQDDAGAAADVELADTSVPPAASLPVELPPRAAKYHQLMRLLQQREALTARLAALQRGETFDSHAAEVLGSVATVTNSNVPVGRKTAKPCVAKRRLRAAEPSSGPDTATEGSSDFDVEIFAPVITSRGRIVKQRRAAADPAVNGFLDMDVYVDDGLGLTSEEQVLLAMQLSMEDAVAPAAP